MRLLVVEDDPDLNRQLTTALSDAGYVVDRAFDGEEGHYLGDSEPYDAVVLDIGLPKMDGISVLEAWRRNKRVMPVLILTARDAAGDVVAGLDAGADDYLRKPFAFDELEARLRSLARRPPNWIDTVLQVGDLVFNSETREAQRGSRDLHLTSKEGLFLEVMMRNPGRTVTRRTLEDRLWDRESDRISNVLDVYARRLRKKLTERGEPQLLHTLRGLGFRLELP